MLNKFKAVRLIRVALVCIITMHSSSIISISEASNDTNTTFAGIPNMKSKTYETQGAAQNRTQITQSNLQTSAPYVTLLPREQRLSHQISIATEEEEEQNEKKSGIGNENSNIKKSSIDKRGQLDFSEATSSSLSNVSQRKRPYNSNTSNLSSLLEKNYYVLEPHYSRSKEKLANSATIKYRPQIVKKIPANQKNLLLRTQHRPPWLSNKPNKPFDGNDSLKLVGKRFKIRATTVPPTTTTTELYRLLSSAHSPVKIITLDSQTNSTKEYNFPPRYATSTTTTRRPETTAALTTTIRSIFTTPRSLEHRTHRPTSSAILSAKIGPNNKSDGRIISPTLMVTDGEADDQELVHKEVPVYKISYDIVDSSNSTKDSPVGGRRQQQQQHHVDLPLSQGELQTTLISDRKPVTIIRHLPRRTTTPIPIYVTEPPIGIKVDERPGSGGSNNNDNLIIEDNSLKESSAVVVPQQLVRLISKQKHKYDDNILSPTLTVVDNDALRLPPNTTAVHNNKLFVAIRPGRPQRKQTTTTEFPYYNIVAAITPPYPAKPSPYPLSRPPPMDGSIWGLVRPNGSEPTTPVPSSSFAAENIKFPAPPPSLEELGGDSHISMPSNVNISIPDSANLLGTNKIPDKVIVETDEQIERPPNSVIISDATMIGRPPYGQNTVTQDGIVRLSTTRRPTRLSTTKRINIVSANTTVITSADPDQLHDVLSNVIAGSHQQNHHHQSNQNRPQSDRPSFLGIVSKLFNAGITTTVIAVLTLIKTIFVAILIMFLPPIALTAAVIQAVG